MNRGILGNMFDGNRDGKLDSWERAIEFAFLDDLEKEKRQVDEEILLEDSLSDIEETEAYYEEVNWDELEYIDEKELYSPGSNNICHSLVDTCSTSKEADDYLYETDYSSEVEKLLKRMKEIKVFLRAHEFTWEDCVKDVKKVADLINAQSKNCRELEKLVTTVLNSNAGKNKEYIEKAVYTLVLETCRELLLEGSKMFSNYNGYKEFFDNGTWHSSQGRINPKVFLEHAMQMDLNYEKTALAQGFWASNFKSLLDENIIFNNKEYIELTKQAAEAFNKHYSSSLKRDNDFFHSHSEERINNEWKLYSNILKGLPIDVIESLDETGWNDAVYYHERHLHNAKFRSEFMRNRKNIREELRIFQENIRDKQYWDAYPEEYKQFITNNNKIEELRIKYNGLKKNISNLENEKNGLINEINKKKFNLEELKYKQLGLQKKIWGKDKAKEQLQIVIAEITKVVHDIQTMEKTLDENDKSIFAIELEKANLKELADKLKAENERLKNKC